MIGLIVFTSFLILTNRTLTPKDYSKYLHSLHQPCTYYKEYKEDATLKNIRLMYDTFHLVKECGNVSLVSHHELNMSHETLNVKNNLVPNIVHYVWFGENVDFTFLNYLSFLSAHKFIKPLQILIHGDTLPIGTWWNATLKQIPNIYFVHRKRPKRINDQYIRLASQSSDIARLELLYG